jgi:stearoyl-CoA desaturase (delta-9 desaturase)
MVTVTLTMATIPKHDTMGLMLGELFQNNHHKYPNSPKFAKKWFEIDPTFYIMRLMNSLKIIQLRKK